MSPGVSWCRGCRAVSGSVEAVSRQCRLTPVSVCRAVSGCSVGAVSGLLDSGDVRTVSRCQAVSECRSVGVSGCRSGVEVSECRCPTQTASILSQSCKFRFLKSNSTFTTTYMGGSLLLWLAAAVWVDWRSRAAAGVCITATVTGKLWYRRRSSTCSPACVGEAHGRAGEHHGLVRGVPGGARAKPR